MGHYVNQGLTVRVRDPEGQPAALNDWRVSFISNTDLNRQSKYFFVPRNEEWHILNIWVEYTAVNAGGARQLVIDLENAVHDILARVIPNTTQDANTVRHYNVGPSLANLDDFYDAAVDWLSTPIPPTWVVPQRTNLHVYEENGINSQDDMIVHVLIGRRLVG